MIYRKDDFIESLSDYPADDWYVTDKEAAEIVIKMYDDFINKDMATTEPQQHPMYIQRITIDYVDGSSVHSDGYLPIPTVMHVTFTIGAVDDTITIGYMNPLQERPIKDKIKKLLGISDVPERPRTDTTTTQERY